MRVNTLMTEVKEPDVTKLKKPVFCSLSM